MFYARYISVLFLFLLAAQPLLAQEAILFKEDFDETALDALPPGWSDLDNEWYVDDASSEGSESGIHNLRGDGGDDAHVTTPSINFTHATAAEFSYQVRRSDSFQDTSFQILASIDGGATFPIVVADTAFAAPDSSDEWTLKQRVLPDALLGEADVRFRFNALPSTGSGGNIRIDDVRVSADWEGGSTFGFTSVSDTTLGNSNSLTIPLQLFYVDSEDLQGMEWTLAWDDERITIDSLSLGPMLGAGWEIHSDINLGHGEILLFNMNSGLSPGHYPALVTLHISTRPMEVDTASTTISMSGIIGAKATPGGTGAVIVPLNPGHTLFIERGYAEPEQSAYTLDLGSTPVDDTSAASVTIANAGTVSLIAERAPGETSPFEPSSDSLFVLPGTEVALEIAHTPTMAAYGYVADTLRFTYEAEDGVGDTISVAVTATGTGGRGDVSQDGLADISDIVQVVDYVIERDEPGAAQRLSADLHPFPTGNGDIDVRDLVVLAQAFLLGEWPDDVTLPARPPDPDPDLQQSLIAGSRTSSGVRVRVSPEELFLETDAPLRGIQLEFDVTSSVEPVVAALEGWTVSAFVDEEEQVLRVLAYSLSGDILTPGTYELLRLDTPVTPLWGVAVDEEEQRHTIKFSTGSSVETQADGLPERFEVGFPYPNPSPAGVAHVRLSLSEAADVRAVVFDVLGRKVASLNVGQRMAGTHVLTWHGRNGHNARVAPGLYLLRIVAGEYSAVRRVVVQ